MPRTFKEQDNGTTADLPIDSSFAVELSENPTTGHRWSDPEIDGGSVVTDSDDFEPASSGAAGAGGVRRFGFRVKSAGRTVIRLAYKRKWEAANDAARRFDITITGR
jgi:inhibitor of cysteine peptidase